MPATIVHVNFDVGVERDLPTVHVNFDVGATRDIPIIHTSFDVGAYRRLPTFITNFCDRPPRPRIVSSNVTYNQQTHSILARAVTNMTCKVLMLAVKGPRALAYADTDPGTEHEAVLRLPQGVSGEVTVFLEVSAIE